MKSSLYPPKPKLAPFSLEREKKNTYRRTYKVGLRVPESLRDPFNNLVREREVLQFLAKSRRKGRQSGWKEFKSHKNLQNHSSNEVMERYHQVFTSYEDSSRENLRKALLVNNGAMKPYKARKLTYSNDLNLKHRIHDPANPKVSEISLHDYQRIASASFLRLCQNNEDFAKAKIDILPVDEKLTERQVTAMVGGSSNHLHSICKDMATMMKVHNDMREKVEYVHDLFFGNEETSPFSDVIPVFLLNYSFPHHLIHYLAKAWNLNDPGWVRNTLVGWRRKMDAHLPVYYQNEPITGAMERVATQLKESCKTEEELKVLSLLQKKYVAHLLLAPSIDLSSLLKKEQKESYFSVRGRVSTMNMDLLSSHLTSLNLDVLENACDRLIHQVKVNLDSYPHESTAYKNTKVFLHKIEFLRAHSQQILPLFSQCLPRRAFLKSVSQLIPTHLHNNGVRSPYKRLFTAVRSIVSLAYAQIYPHASAILESCFTPDICTTRPYKGKKRRAKPLPLLLKSPKYVVLRKNSPHSERTIPNRISKKTAQNTSLTTTKLFAEAKPLWIGLQLYSPGQFRENCTLKGRHKGILWFEIYASKKIRTCILNGAEVEAIRLNVPRGPSKKIIADIILVSKDARAFYHATNFLEKWERDNPSLTIPLSNYIGSDFNTLGKNMVALSNRQGKISLELFAKEFERIKAKLEFQRKVHIPRLQKLIDQNPDDARVKKWKGDLSLNHEKRENILKEMYIYTFV